MNTNRQPNGNPAACNTFIAHRGVACLNDARGQTVRVERGSVWITQDGSSDDLCLHAGESFIVAHNGLTVVTACAGPAVIAINDYAEALPKLGDRLRRYCHAALAPSSRPSVVSR